MGRSELIDAAESPLWRGRVSTRKWLLLTCAPAIAFCTCCTLWRLLDADCVSLAPSAHLSHRGHGCKARSGRAAWPSGAAREGVSALQERRRLDAGQRPARPPAVGKEAPRPGGWRGQRASLVSPHGRASREAVKLDREPVRDRHFQDAAIILARCTAD